FEEASYWHSNYGRLKRSDNKFLAVIGKERKDITKAEIDNYKTENRDIKTAISIIKRATENGSFLKLFDDINEANDYYSSQIKYHLNKEFDPLHIVGDNYEDASKRYYSNPYVKGPNTDYGTH